jgi:hypothetical protein
MDKRFQVFISSTYKDLQDERQEVMQALLELDCIPSGMELFPAANETQWEIIKKVIEDCDYYILILAGRYGSVAEDGYSYTEKEYDYATSIGKPVLSFTHRNVGKIIADKTEDSEVGREKLKNFKTKVQKKLCKEWETPTELGSVVSRSMVQLMKSSPAVGWVKADQVADTEATQEILNLKKTIEELEQEIKNLTKQQSNEIEELSQGQEKIKIGYEFISIDSNYKRTSWTATFTPTWNDIIANVFPVCINEAKETDIIKQFNLYIEKERLDILYGDKRLKNQRIDRIKIEMDDFHTVIIQLRALNIIRKSTKTKSVKDTATYWSLTENGDNQLVLLRAIRRREIDDVNEINQANDD